MTNGNKSANKQGVQFDVAPLPNQEAIVHFKDKVLLDSRSYLDVLAHEHAIAFVVAGMADADLLAETKAAIQSALDSGSNFNAFKRRLKPYLTAKGWLSKDSKTASRRLRLIYHTNLHTAYAAGQWQRIQKTKEFLPYLQYMPSVSENPRLSHKRYYDLVRPVDDAIWQQISPPNSYNCKCWVKQLTKRQAQKVGISEETPLEMVDYENPKTGEKSQVPAGIDPSFNHNHDRLTALFKLAEDKHGSPFTQALQAQLTDFMLDMAKNKGVAVANFTGVVARQTEIERLLIDKLDNKPKLNEAHAGAEYQTYYGIRLERPEPTFVNGNPQAGFDYWVTDTGQTLDFMYTMYGYNQFKIDKFNEFFAHTDEVWENKKEQIVHHLGKADIIPLDLRYLTTENIVKLMAFVLSLPKEQQVKIILITGT